MFVEANITAAWKTRGPCIHPCCSRCYFVVIVVFSVLVSVRLSFCLPVTGLLSRCVRGASIVAQYSFRVCDRLTMTAVIAVVVDVVVVIILINRSVKGGDNKENDVLSSAVNSKPSGFLTPS